MDFKKYISINKDVRFGKACITGTRISVYDVLSWYASGMDMTEILTDFPQLNKIKYLLVYLMLLKKNEN